jgi:recombinational DNA repair protein RecT
VQWYDEMARKSSVRRLCKYLPYMPELEYAIEKATAAESHEDTTTATPALDTGVSRAAQLAQRIKQQSVPEHDADGVVQEDPQSSDVAQSDNPDEGP